MNSRAFTFSLSIFALSFFTVSATWSPPITIAPVTSSLSPAHPLAIDTNSNATVGWLDTLSSIGHNIFSQFLPSGATTWQSPLLIDSDTAPLFLFPPNLNADKFGNQYAGWLEYQTPFATNTGTAFRAVKSLSDTAWPAPSGALVSRFPSGSHTSTDLLGNSQTIFAEGLVVPLDIVFFTSSNPGVPLLLDSTLGLPAVVSNFANNGRGVVLWKTLNPTLTLMVDRFDVATNQLTPTSNVPLPVGTINITAASIGLDANGNSVVLFVATVGATSEVFASTMVAGSTTWSQPILISNASNQANLIDIAMDGFGNAYLMWTEKPSVSQEFVRAATLPLNGSPIKVTDLSNPLLPASSIDPSMHIVADSFGNAIAIWGVGLGGIFEIQVSEQPVGQSWDPTILSGSGRTPNVALSDQETAVAVWVELGPNQVTGAINTFPFPLAPPTNFTAAVIKRSFLLQTEFLLRLTWDPSPAPNIVRYEIRRDGVLIATIPGSDPLTAQFCLRSDRAGVITIVAIASNGNESLPVTATVL